jgi:hypothetical protein
VLVIEPVLLLGAAALITRVWSKSQRSLLSIMNQFARSLVPLGFGIWLAHYGFHFLTGYLTVIPVSQSAAHEAFGAFILGKPLWRLGGLSAATVFPLELGFMTLGLVGSLVITWSIATQVSARRVYAAFVPWALVHSALFSSGVWVMTQPMDMRGTFLGG